MLTPAAPTLEAEIAVVGGGLGAVAAALAAARRGRRVLLCSPTARLGGQATTQLVPALDEFPLVETCGISRSYRAFREAVRARYDGLANPGDGWVSRLCFEPAAAGHVIDELLAPHLASGALVVERGLRPHRAVRDGDRLAEVHFRAGEPAAGPGRPRGGEVAVRAEVFLDATEAGDLLPLAGADWIAGSEGREAHDEPLALPGGPHPGAVQSCTVGFVVEHLPDQDHTGPEPEGYAELRDSQPFTLEIAGWDDRVHRYRMFADGPDGHPPFWTYRRLRSGALLGGRDVALINWSGNDYAGTSSLDDPDGTYARAKHLSAAFLHWLRTECPRDDGSGRGYPGLRLRPDVAGTADGFAAEAYLRESRRLVTGRVIRQQDLTPVPGKARAAAVADAAGLASYHMDLHARIGHSASAYAPTAPFQVPLSALAAPRPGNLLAAAKNLGATQVAAAAYRVHHGEWAVGEAAGAFAAHCGARSRLPAQVLADRRELTRLQRALVADGIPLAWLLDLPVDDPVAGPAHLLAGAGGLTGTRESELAVRPSEPVPESERQALHATADLLVGRRLPGVTAQPTWRAQVRELGRQLEAALEM
ncbi:FAD-dependent oxidoreductase [Streptomyces sp. MAR4 CNY-716]